MLTPIIFLVLAFNSNLVGCFLLNADHRQQTLINAKAEEVTDEEIGQLANHLFNNDENNIGHLVQVNLQGVTDGDKKDHAESDLLTLKEGANLPESIRILDAIHENYRFIRSENETMPDEEYQLILKFNEKIVKSSLVQQVGEFLVKKNIFSSLETFEEQFLHLWFDLYKNPTRKTDLKMISGFEHVFLGEIDYESVGGFHNWYRFYKQEQERTMNYLGHYRVLDLGRNSTIVTFQFIWYGHLKFIGSIWTGTSPEFELAIYTLCIHTRPMGYCNVRINGQEFDVVNYELIYNNRTYVATSYPNHPR